MSDNHALTAMIASRICHDLISPLGAISNGVELLQLTLPEASGPELELIGQSIRSATARTRFLRLAFGVAGDGQLIGHAELSQMIRDWAEGGRVLVHWSLTGSCSRRQARRGLLALMCLETALPQGGVITVAEAGTGWSFLAEGLRARLPPDLWAMLTEPQAPVEVTPGRIHFALLREDLLDGAGLASGRVEEGRLDLRLP